MTMPRKPSFASTKKLYDGLRRRYFMDAPPPLRVPPKSFEFAWMWLPWNSSNLGVTYLDEDRDVEVVGLSPILQLSPWMMRATLLHELTHMRDPEIGCASKRWLEETRRLVDLGAWYI